jgi:hypothetical protein
MRKATVEQDALSEIVKLARKIVETAEGSMWKKADSGQRSTSGASQESIKVSVANE